MFQHDRFGVIEYDRDDGVWRGSHPLPLFEGCGWDEQHVSEHLSPSFDDDGRRVRPPEGEPFSPRPSPPDGFAGKPLRIEFRSRAGEGEEVPPPTGGQLAAFRFVVDNEREILDAILDALAERFGGADPEEFEMSFGLSEEDSGRLARLLEDRDGVRSMVRFEAVCVSDRETPEGVAVGFHGDIGLDEEHGFGVVTRGGTMLRVGGSDIGWSARA